MTAWFGYKIHLLVDATYELPIAWTVTKASTADITEAPPLLAQLKTHHPMALSAARYLTADRGYDATAWVQSVWDDEGIKPVIAIRNKWKDGETTRVLPGHETVTYTYRGEVFGHHPETGEAHPMANGGFEADRATLKKRCPAKFAGITGEAQATCPVAHGLRIRLATDRRIFTPLDRSRYTWAREYAHRTAVERVNSRLDVSFGFEVHTIRGMAKMRAPLRVGAPGHARSGTRTHPAKASGTAPEFGPQRLSAALNIPQCHRAPVPPTKHPGCASWGPSSLRSINGRRVLGLITGWPWPMGFALCKIAWQSSGEMPQRKKLPKEKC